MKRDLIIFNGTIHTMDQVHNRCEAVLVRDGRIASTGDLADVESVAAPDSERYDLDGNTLLPGFNDNHIHATGLGDNFSIPNLRGLSKQEILETLTERYSNEPPSVWAIANNWDFPTCPDPSREDLDAVFPKRPAILFQFSGHAAWLNSAALEHFDIDRNTPDWTEGEILHDEAGEPNGLIREPITYPPIRKQWMRRMIDKTRIERSLQMAMVKLREAGITSVQDNTWFPQTLGALKRLKRRDELTCRFSCWILGAQRPLDIWMNLKRYDEAWIRKGPMKFFIDGAFSSRSAWLTEEYADDQGNRGKGLSSEEIESQIKRYLRRGRQIASHAIGDEATRAYCDAVERLAASNPSVRDLRIRIEHGQLIRPEDVARIRELGMCVSAQPSALNDPEKDLRLLGPERVKHAYPYRTLLDSGVNLSFGSDFPGESSFEPLLSIQYAVTRDGPERITVEEAIRCYTLGSAYAEGTESVKGSITPGKYADFVVLEQDPLEVDSHSIADIPVHATMVNGEFVYQRTEDLPSSTEMERTTLLREVRDSL